MKKRALLIVTLLISFSFVPTVQSQDIQSQDLQSPEQYFGFEMGADRKLADWDELYEYYKTLAAASDHMKLVEMGPSTQDNPFIVLFISSAANLANLDQIQHWNNILSDPRGYSEADIDDAIQNGKAIVLQSYGLHSSEVAGTQAAADIVFEMLSRSDEDMTRIRENTVAIMIPSFNPDGTNMIADWYAETVGTEYEGNGMPWLYHYYIGHDNNRDAFMRNTIESEYGARLIFREWVPQAYIDHHQMGAYSARLYVPPYAEPIRPGGDPLVWREMSWYGAHIAYKEEEAGKAGVVNAAIYSGWGHFGFHWITPFHNIAGMLTESASARLATPLFVHPDQLSGGRRGLPAYEEQTSFPNPWKGGWWRVRDIVEQQNIATIAALDIAARNRTTVLRNAYLKSSRQIERGKQDKTKAYVIPAEQHDKLTMYKMVNVLLGQGIQVDRIDTPFVHEGRTYGAGTFVVSNAQPKRGVIRWLLGQTNYPDNTYTRNRDGSPIGPYDMSTDNIAEYMGVRVDAVSTPVAVQMMRQSEDIKPSGTANSGSAGYVIDGRLSDSFTAVNLAWNAGIEVHRIDALTRVGSVTLRPGDFVIPTGADADDISRIAKETGVDFLPLDASTSFESHAVTRLRIGLFQRYWGGNIDEGWTRMLLENFGFPYETIRDAEILSGQLNENFDVIILPHDSADRMTGKWADGGSGYTGRGMESTPEKYRSGFGDEGVDSLKSFVENGGTLLTIGGASDLVISEFNIPVRNVLSEVPSTSFWSPGSTLRIDIDPSHPLSYGMPANGLVLFQRGNHAYQVITSDRNHDVDRIATFVERDVMESGWLLGEDRIVNRAAIIQIRQGEGRLILYGFQPEHRVQTHGTFKFIFNALVSQPPE